MAFAIFEGGDGTGKSTFSDSVAKAFRNVSRADSVKQIHCGPPKKDVLDEYALDIENYRPDNNLDIVADRWHLGTLVYAQLYRDTGPYGELGLAGFRWVEMFLAARGAVAWVVDQDYDLVKHRLETRGEDYLEARHVEWVLERFREIAEESMLVRGIVRPHEGDQTELAQQHRDIAIGAEMLALPIAKFLPGYIGAPRPDVLLVGDKREEMNAERTKSPMFPDPTSPGAYLLGSLPSDLWPTVGIIDAEESDVPGFIDALGYTPKVVALGRDASNELLDHDIIHAGVPHPRIVRRSAAKRRDEYGQLIHEAAATGKVAFSWPN